MSVHSTLPGHRAHCGSLTAHTYSRQRWGLQAGLRETRVSPFLRGAGTMLGQGSHVLTSITATESSLCLDVRAPEGESGILSSPIFQSSPGPAPTAPSLSPTLLQDPDPQLPCVPTALLRLSEAGQRASPPQPGSLPLPGDTRVHSNPAKAQEVPVSRALRTPGLGTESRVCGRWGWVHWQDWALTL